MLEEAGGGARGEPVELVGGCTSRGRWRWMVEAMDLTGGVPRGERECVRERRERRERVRIRIWENRG